RGAGLGGAGGGGGEGGGGGGGGGVAPRVLGVRGRHNQAPDPREPSQGSTVLSDPCAPASVANDPIGEKILPVRRLGWLLCAVACSSPAALPGSDAAIGPVSPDAAL